MTIIDKIYEKIKLSSWYRILFERDKFADEIYFFKEDEILKEKKIEINQEFPLKGVEKWKYNLQNLFVQTYIFKSIDSSNTLKTKIWKIKAKTADDVSIQIKKIYWMDTHWYSLYQGDTIYEKFLADPLFLFKKVTLKEIKNFSKQLWRLIKSGVDLQTGLEVNIRNTKNWKFKAVLEDIFETLRTGETMSVWCEKYPNIFPKLYISLLAMSEKKTANLGDVLTNLANVMDKEMKLIWKMKSAMIMPILTIVVTIWVVIFLMTGMVPAIVALYRDLWWSLPRQTILLMSMSDFMLNHWIFLVWMTIWLIAWYVFLLKVLAFREIKDYVFSKIPFFWLMINLKEQIQLIRIIWSMLEKNWDFIDSFQICWEATENTMYKNASSVLASNMKKWKSFYFSMLEAQTIIGDIWSQNLLTIIETGEKSWSLSRALLEEADQMEYDLDEAQARFITALTPCILIILAFVIWFIVWAAMSPMYNPSLWR